MTPIMKGKYKIATGGHTLDHLGPYYITDTHTHKYLLKDKSLDIQMHPEDEELNGWCWTVEEALKRINSLTPKTVIGGVLL